MADVSSDRGQLFLVGAIALAVLFVVLALLMNTAIYTENIATRGTDAGSDGAIRYGQSVRAGTGGLVRYVNEHNDTTYGTLSANLSAGVGSMSDAASVQHVYDGVDASAALVATENGTRIGHDNATRAFTAGGAADGSADWTLAAGVNRTRAFRLNVSRDGLAPAGTGAFRVVVSNGSATWRTRVYDDGDRVVVEVENGSETTWTGTCGGPSGADHAVVDLTRGTVGGEPCPLLGFGKGVSGTYAVAFENGDRANGTYGLVVDDPTLVGDPNDVYFAEPSGDSPYIAPAIYAATVEVIYEGPQITYRTNVTAAPEART